MADWARALDELVRSRGVALTRYAYLLSGDHREAEDLVQDALVKTFSRSRLLHDSGSIEAYVRQAILTTYVDGFRRRQRWAAIRHLAARPETRLGPDQTSSDRIDLEAALGALSPRERACVVLRFYEDLTVPEIAHRLSLAPGTVKRYLSDAVRRLEDRLGSMPPDLHEEHDVVLVATARSAR
ncbi:sigma-70 family RNA polymerase sigma factor [Cellulomonas chengniuliangii]|uniref:Sigma-70 family RNA polymerase sigma factor n=1 Tax=Cellulomonas chengniuliangii TaxID=2968084 RepID=A0ABY5L0B7_9CELL|nr:sigma-70 family RNA polymerase sigma factor [Cellulomonas chengniuliangii]MCC2309494.1 sigma-70 family RNA polymerase sigma factor [Cellulomonas chengniuliangii]MCC2316765.1 sigma-70 family RNA polymerase sigma factor [Cellulomonas chengniuliangii]UUI74947.1 sigma-70 family RNA polymerase sigma factor [Cellulomonas chengniuliangii]